MASGPSARSPAPVSFDLLKLGGRAMQRSSASIGTIAAALAKAQIELTNPEKSLVGDHPSRNAGRAVHGISAMRRCRAGSRSCARLWASMRSRPCRPPRSIEAAGIVRLTTVLAHSSGEWMASDWPVCPIARRRAPHRMGAALTYARRYALFTLVGIAGEDDLDAPDLIGPAPETEKLSIESKSVGNGGQHTSFKSRAGRGRANRIPALLHRTPSFRWLYRRA